MSAVLTPPPVFALLVLGMLGAVLGVAVQLQWASLPGLWVHALVAAVGAALLGLCWAAPLRWRYGLVLLALASLAWSATGARALAMQGQALAPELEGRDLLVTGVVAGLPREGEFGSSFEFAVESARLDGVAVELPPRLRLSWHQGGFDRAAAPTAPARVRPGERWQFQVQLQRPHGLSNPGGFDAELWFWEQGLGAQGRVRSGGRAQAPRLLADTWRYPVQRARYLMRERLHNAVADERAAGVMVGLLAGDQAAISQQDWDIFRDTGVAHLISVSGLHITMFAWLAMMILRRVWTAAGRRRPALLWRVPTPVAAQVGGLALATAYAVFAGWGVPAQRTVLMLATIVVLRLSGRHWPWPVVWLAAMNTVVWIDPWALMEPGFWLSFVAVGVLFATGAGPAATVQGRSRWQQEGRTMLRTQAIVTVALAPLTLLLFGMFSVVGLVANLVAIPWVTLLVTPLTMLGALIPGLWWLTAQLVQALLWVLQAMAQWPFAMIERPALPLALAVLAVCGGVLLVLPWPLAWRWWGALLLWPALVFEPARPPYGEFELLAADVGQGTAVVVRTARHTLLYDTGPPWGRSGTVAERVLIPLLRQQGERPDMIMVSHDDSDHAAGASVLDAAFPAARWKSSGPLPVRQVVTGCVAGQQWVWDGVLFEVLHPRLHDYGAGLSANEMSCVLRVGGDKGALLTGDIYIDQETRLALDQPDLRAHVLVLAHHGSKTSTGPVWLNTLQPRWAIVQAGHRNRYGHPAPEVVRRLGARQIAWVESATCGAATWRSQHPDTMICQRQQKRRYWHHHSIQRQSELPDRP